MKTWARWTLLILWTVGLILTAQYWNPFASLPAFLKYSVITLVVAVLYGAFFIIIQFYIMLSVIFPLPPRADSKAPKSIGKRWFKWLYKESPISPNAPKTLEEMTGNDKAKQEIREVLDIIQKAKHYEDSGAQVPKGMLFVGPPGVGKTLFARAIANEAGVPFYVIDGGGVAGIFMGLGVLKLKTLFRKLKAHDRAILFIDEIESMGSKRSQDQGFGGIADMNMTLNCLLTEMDGFSGSKIMVIGATNNDAMLDPALMRAGRMDRRIYFQMPTPDERKDLFKYYLGKVACDENIDYDQVSMLTANYSPAEIANVINEAALISRRPGNPNKVTTDMILQALDRVSVGLERSLTNSGVELVNHDPSVRFADVIGIDDIKQEVVEIVDFLKRGDDLRKIGAKIPKGVLLVGPPGVGKSMMAKAIANEAGVPFYGLSASYLNGMGFGAQRIKALYTQARQSPAAIVFIDEIDAIGGTKGGALGSIRTNSLNQLLVELDGLGRSNVITIGATNMEDDLDAAFYRSGRFDRKVFIGVPDTKSRSLIFEKYLKQISLASLPDLEKLGKLSFNFSGADIAAACNEAAILAVRKGKSQVTEEELEEAIDKVMVTAGHKLNVAGMNLSRVPDLEITLDDLKGVEEAKAEAAEVVAMLKNMQAVEAFGLKPTKGVLLVGPPGTGKTMLAKAIANEAGVQFYSLSGGDFQSMWAGVGSNRVKAVYERARRSGKPAIVFIDEIDAIGGRRGFDMGGGAVQDSNKTLNSLLVEMDGFGKHKILTIGATNNMKLLDRALLRPGRFDRHIDVPLPNLEGREAILTKYLEKFKVSSNVHVLEIARMTFMQAGADLANIANEAGLMAIREGRTEITHSDLIRAIQRVSFGMSRSQHIGVKELFETAYHEAGHTIVSYFRNRKERIQVVTVVPTGRTLGYMWSVDKEDRFVSGANKQDYLVDIEVSLGGYVAESLYMETTTSGVSQDLRNVGDIARNMIKSWGMGSFAFNTDVAHSVPGKWEKASPETEREIELEIKKTVDDCLTNVRNLLKDKRKELDLIAHGLVEKETLFYKDLVHILEPSKTDEQINKEIATLSERKLVGTAPIVNLEFLPGLTQIGQQGGSGNPDNNKVTDYNDGRDLDDDQDPENFRPEN